MIQTSLKIQPFFKTKANFLSEQVIFIWFVSCPNPHSIYECVWQNYENMCWSPAIWTLSCHMSNPRACRVYWENRLMAFRRINPRRYYVVLHRDLSTRLRAKVLTSCHLFKRNVEPGLNRDWPPISLCDLSELNWSLWLRAHKAHVASKEVVKF